MNKTIQAGVLLLSGLVAHAAVAETIVQPTRVGGFTSRGGATSSVTHVVNSPSVNVFTEYSENNGFENGVSRIEVPVTDLPKFDDSLGTLVAINITLTADFETIVSVEANVIDDPMFEHEAGFFTENTIFNDTAGYPAAALLQRPTNDPRAIAPGFHPIGAVDAFCYGVPGDMESCGSDEFFFLQADTTVDVFVFEDLDGPIYTLSDWVGTGFVPGLSVYVDHPGPGPFEEDQFGFYLDNVFDAYGALDSTLYQGTITVEYVYQIDATDTDGDGFSDAVDNCTLAVNPDQTDTNGDGYGNACDADLNDDGIVNTEDLGIFRAAYFSSGVSDTDFNADGFTNAVDLGIIRSQFFGPPGPSALVP